MALKTNKNIAVRKRLGLMTRTCLPLRLVMIFCQCIKGMNFELISYHSMWRHVESLIFKYRFLFHIFVRGPFQLNFRYFL